MGRVAILGPGLLGGSLALALKRRPGVTVSMWARRQAAVDEALAMGVCDHAGTDAEGVVADADLVVLATPVRVMGEVFERASAGLLSGALVTDVGSVKEPVVRTLGDAVRQAGGAFVGSHPMAGSENAGIGHARGDLFEGAACLVTPEPCVESGVVDRLRGFWESVGCRVTVVGAEEHDAMVARISHVPHAVASVLVNVVLSERPDLAEVAGGGFRDTTRVAAGDPGLWQGILEENRTAVGPVLRELAAELEGLAGILERGDGEALLEVLDRARKLRQGCPPNS